MHSSAIKRHGGKAYLAPKLIELMPYHNRYAECYFGSGAVLFAKSYDGIAEYANDLDGALTIFWNTVADPNAFAIFQLLVNATPFSKPGFEKAKGRLEDADVNEWRWDDEVRQAADFFIVNRQSRQALGKDFATPTTRLRGGMNENVSAWLSAVESLPWFHNRLKRVEIRCEDARDFIASLDKSDDTLFYCDPPYISSTRGSARNEYGKFEMSDIAHKLLLEKLQQVRGKVMLSGYSNPMYDEMLHGWRYVDFEIDNKASSSDTKEIKIERVWMNYEI